MKPLHQCLNRRFAVNFPMMDKNLSVLAKVFEERKRNINIDNCIVELKITVFDCTIHHHLEDSIVELKFLLKMLAGLF